ncbi:MAG: TlpA family protein disulfide reductase [Muribaculum sp.]|nr:TlpA family protein disulfide reductase [Muribaculum sp.]
MKKYFAIAAMAIVSAICSSEISADINVVFSPRLGLKEVVVSAIPVKDMLNRDARVVTDTLKVVDNKVTVPLAVPSLADYRVILAPRQYVDIYAAPGENLNAQITDAYTYRVSGSTLTDDISKLQDTLAPIDAEYEALMKADNLSEETVMPLVRKYQQSILGFISANPDSPAAAYALMDIEEPEVFLQALDALSATARTSDFYPVAVRKGELLKEKMERDYRRNALASGEVAAPDFTLNGLDGKPVSLSDYRGKWVVIDFWGAWCKWCIKGFPALKQAYSDYDGRLEVIGVDNRDSIADWKAAVERFKLPWVQVYNPGNDDSGVLKAYMVENFPTKAIINPEGKIVDITVGEDPSFFDRLAKFMGK